MPAVESEADASDTGAFVPAGEAAGTVASLSFALVLKKRQATHP